MSDAETTSKDAFFLRLADIAKEMTNAHGKDFAMGALVLAARYIAESQACERAAGSGAGAPAAGLSGSSKAQP